MMNNFTPYTHQEFTAKEMLTRSLAFYQWTDKRRSLRFFSDKVVDKEIIRNIIMTASTAPSGAHKQPWTFCVVENPAIKKAIREAAEEEEKENYSGRMSEEWLPHLAPFGTDW